ncbi:MAG: hypothetical protein A2Y62_17535 [Candidatus Fischerbacteria bacterium RBG_13_37_8]|uniref:Glycosyltransferase RgtA/B/C/D-like domain-containing protein n=1 Tax=Candidatus Fischerbacteria bacterium RBG_13_37_8 TaxID=1817863 RepID=A0A1F5VP60_9BACT|nr:MAG: hypothetical protein A2Y62_17535 [Candidatus Fischerbacteria bacterium RBG_13_37_8]
MEKVEDKAINTSVEEELHSSPFLKNIAIPVGLFLFSFLERVFFILGNLDRKYPFSVFYYGDAMKYHDYAISLMKGALYDNGIPYHPPFFAWVMAGIYYLMGTPGQWAFSGIPYKIVYALINSCVCVLLYYLALQFAQKKVAIIICLLFSLSFGMCVLSATPNNENVYLLILTAMLLIAVKNRVLNSYKIAVVLGILMGTGALTRAEHLVFLPFLLLYFYINKEKPLRQSQKYYVVIVLFTFLTLAPWMARNYIIISSFNAHYSTGNLELMSPFVLVTNYGPVNFVMANNQTAQGGFSREILNTLSGEASLNLNNSQHRHYFIHGYREGIKWILQNPADYLWLCIKKVSISLDAMALGFTSWDVPSGLNGLRRAVDVFAPHNNWFKYPFTLLVIAGFIFSLLKDFRKNILFHFVVVHKIIVILLFYGYVRQILSIYVVILIFAGFVFEKLKPKMIKMLLIVIVVGALIGCIYDGVTVANPKNYTVSGSSDPVTGYIIQDAKMEIMLKKQ